MKKLFTILATIVVAVSVWGAAGDPYFTLSWANKTSGTTQTTYASSSDLTFTDGDVVMTWACPGNQQSTAPNFRVGGASGTNVARTIVAKSSMGAAISKVTINHSGTSSDKISVPQIQLVVALDANFNSIVETKTLTAANEDYIIGKTTNGSIEITPTSTAWSSGSYYKIVITYTNTDTKNNRYFGINSIVFTEGQGGVSAPIISAESTLDVEAAAGIGEISYSIVNPNSSTLVPSVAPEITWISNFGVDATSGKVTFDVAANTGAARSAVVTLTYGTATKNVTVNQARYIDPNSVHPLNDLSWSAYQTETDWTLTTWSSSSTTSTSAYYSVYQVPLVSPATTFGSYESAKFTVNMRTVGGVSGNSNVLTIKFGETVLGTITAANNSLADYELSVSNLPAGNGQLSFVSGATDAAKGLGIRSITIEGSTRPVAPTFSVNAGLIEEPTSVTISSGAGCVIYYTTNGEEPTTSSTLYSSAITIDHNMTIKAIAEKDGETSDVASVTYTYVDLSTLYKATWVAADHNYANAANVSSVDLSESSTATFAQGGNSSNAPKYYTSGTGVRLYTDNTMTITSAFNIIKIDLTFADGYKGNVGVNVGTYLDGVWTGTAKSIVFTEGSANDAARLQSINIYTEQGYGSFKVTDINGTGWGTYYTDFAFVMPENVEGQIMKEVDGSITNVTTYEAGAVVPAETALLLKGTADTYDLVETTTDPTVSAEGNLLKGLLEEGETTGGSKYYLLANGQNGLGWYYGATDGAAFITAAHKAYLALSSSSAPTRILLNMNGTDTATSIDNIECEKAVKFFENGQVIILRDGIRYNALGQIVK